MANNNTKCGCDFNIKTVGNCDISKLNLNGKDDFKYVEAKPNEDNSSSAMTVSDTTHPNVSGYKSLAKGTYDVLNYIYR